jgi:MFS family permease
LVARFVSGVSIGLLTATATAHLTELHFASRPGDSRNRADLVATAANLGGIGLGPLIAGLLAQYVTQPLRVPFLVFEVLLLLGVIAIALAPETVERPQTTSAYRPQRVAIPAAGRSRYFAAAVAGMAEFAVFGLFTSLASAFWPERCTSIPTRSPDWSRSSCSARPRPPRPRWLAFGWIGSWPSGSWAWPPGSSS